MIRLLFMALMAASLGLPAIAGPVQLRANPVDTDGRVTFGDVFEGVGPSAAGIVIATRVGPSVVFDAGPLQAQALRAGLQWDNPRGLSRVVVRAAETASAAPATSAASGARPGATVEVLTYSRNIATGEVIRAEDVVWTTLQAHQAPSGSITDPDRAIGLIARRALRSGASVGTRDLTTPQVIARNDLVEVAFISGGVKLTITGRASRNAAAGEAVPVVNLQSGRTIDAVAVAPGRAVAGPAAQAARADPNQFSNL